MKKTKKATSKKAAAVELDGNLAAARKLNAIKSNRSRKERKEWRETIERFFATLR